LRSDLASYTNDPSGPISRVRHGVDESSKQWKQSAAAMRKQFTA